MGARNASSSTSNTTAASREGIASQDQWIQDAAEVMEVEAAAISLLAGRLGDSFLAALDLLDRCNTKVVATGVGKSGIAARKIAATLTSTGCPAVFLHPTEAMHGDLGLVSSGDIVLALSHSGESEELLAILPTLRSRGVEVVALTGNPHSEVARSASIVLDTSVEREACPLNLAPTTSVVVAIALGDALAMTLQKRRGFRAEDYALNHPGGRLGRRLTLRVADVMRQRRESLPVVNQDAALLDILSEITAKCVGATSVLDADRRLLGIITDHDVRRAVQSAGPASFGLRAREIMNATPAVVLAPDQMAYEALQVLEDRQRPISVAPVVDETGRCVAMIHVHDLVRAGL